MTTTFPGSVDQAATAAVTIRVLTLAQHEADPGDLRGAALTLDEGGDADDDRLPPRRRFNWHALNRGRWAERALHDGKLQCHHPRTGQQVTARFAYTLQARQLGWLAIIYEFDGPEPFFLITSNWIQMKLGLYSPGHQLLIAGNFDADWIGIATSALKFFLERRAAAAPWAAVAGVAAPRTGAVLFVGYTCKNLGHYIWNDLSGLEAALAGAARPPVAAIVAGRDAYMPVAGIFPETEDAGIPVLTWASDPAELIRFDLAVAPLPLRVSGNQISVRLRRRIVGWALASQHDALSEIASLNASDFVLWFNLRAHNKAWANGHDGIVHICRAFRQALGPVAGFTLILDGTRDTTPLVEALRRALSGIVEVVDATRVPLCRSIVLSSLIDLHVCIVGSGLTLAHWVMGRRGLAHSNTLHMAQQAWWNAIAEGTRDMVFLPVSAISNQASPTEPDASYVNYVADPNQFLACLEPLFRQVNARLRRSSVEQMIDLARQGKYLEAAERVSSL
jgi:hypothetical protein